MKFARKRSQHAKIDVGIHTGTMTFDEGVQLLVDKVRLERYAAELDVGMYTRRPTMVLRYLIGMMEIQDIRAKWEEKYGKSAKPKEFFDKLLRTGAIPPVSCGASCWCRRPNPLSRRSRERPWSRAR